MSFAYLSDTRHLTERKRNVIKTIKHTHSGIHTYPVLSSSIQKNISGWDREVHLGGFLFVSYRRLLQDNSWSISGGICQRESLCSGDDAFFQTILMIGTAHLVRGSKWYREEITLSERAYIIAGDDLFIIKEEGDGVRMTITASIHRRI